MATTLEVIRAVLARIQAAYEDHDCLFVCHILDQKYAEVYCMTEFSAEELVMAKCDFLRRFDKFGTEGKVHSFWASAEDRIAALQQWVAELEGEGAEP